MQIEYDIEKYHTIIEKKKRQSGISKQKGMALNTHSTCAEVVMIEIDQADLETIQAGFTGETPTTHDQVIQVGHDVR